MEGEDDLEALMKRIPAHRPATTPNSEVVKCCCGHEDCAFLKHNCSALDELEEEVRTAARLGQVRTSLCLYSCHTLWPSEILVSWGLEGWQGVV